MSDEREPLWSDEKINWQVDLSAASAQEAYRTKKMVRKVRDDYEAQLSNQYQRIERFVELVNQLEAQLAQRWEPLPDGVYDCQHDSCKVTVDGEWLEASDELYSVSVSVALLDNIRLCRLVTQEPTL